MWFILSRQSYKFDSSITEAISRFSSPSDLHSFFGLVNQLTVSTDTVAPLLAPLRPLLGTKTNFLWAAEHD
jgi:hypothetical protein